MAHPAHEVPVRRRNGPLSCSEYAHVSAEARSAGRCAECSAGINKDINQSFLQCLFINSLCGGDDDHTHIGMHLVPLDHLRRLAYVLDPSVGAGAYDRLVDVDRGELAHGLYILWQVRTSDLRLHACEVVFPHIRINRLSVALVEFIFPARPLCDIPLRDLVGFDDAVFRTGLDGHIADSEPARHRQSSDHISRKLHGAVERSVHADVTYGA